MKILIDNALSPVIAKRLKKHGIDAIHIRTIGMQDASDREIFTFAYKDDRAIITADTDFGYLLSRWNKNKPSVIIFRKGTDRNPEKQFQILELNLDPLKKDIMKGCIVIIEPQRIRIKYLPIFENRSK